MYACVCVCGTCVSECKYVCGAHVWVWALTMMLRRGLGTMPQQLWGASRQDHGRSSPIRLRAGKPPATSEVPGKGAARCKAQPGEVSGACEKFSLTKPIGLWPWYSLWYPHFIESQQLMLILLYTFFLILFFTAKKDNVLHFCVC